MTSNREHGLRILKDTLDAHIGHGARKIHRMRSIESVSYNSMPPYLIDSQVITESSTDIYMSKQAFERLLDILGHYRTNGNFEYYEKDRYERLEFESELREKYPGVKRAFENYQTMLAMVKEGKHIDHG